MAVIKETWFRHLFTLLCIIGVTFMVGYWIYKFSVEDRDIGVVDYITLEDMPDAEVPLPVLCFQNPFLPERISEISKYINYLTGNGFDDELGNIDYANVTLNLNDYFMFSKVRWRNGSVVTYGSAHVIQREIFNGWFGVQSSLYK